MVHTFDMMDEWGVAVQAETVDGSQTRDVAREFGKLGLILCAGRC